MPRPYRFIRTRPLGSSISVQPIFQILISTSCFLIKSVLGFAIMNDVKRTPTQNLEAMPMCMYMCMYSVFDSQGGRTRG